MGRIFKPKTPDTSASKRAAEQAIRESEARTADLARQREDAEARLREQEAADRERRQRSIARGFSSLLTFGLSGATGRRRQLLKEQ